MDVAGGGALPRIPAEDARGACGTLPGTVRRGRPGMAEGTERTRRHAEREGRAECRETRRGSAGQATGRLPRVVLRQGGAVRGACRCAAVLSATRAGSDCGNRERAEGTG